jgi:polysaccharide biosynthesis protein PslG
VRRNRALAAIVAASFALLLLGASSAAARAPLPPGFLGVVPQGPLAPSDFARMRGVVGTLRIPVYWPQVEPRPGALDFSGLDSTVLAAAGAGARVLPFVYGTPGWLASEPARPPLGPKARSAWARFLRALAKRYGPGGELWAGERARPAIRRWQIWNEPNFLLFWRPRPSPIGYARLLRISARSLHAVDPGAQIVAAGLAPVEGGMLPWRFLRKLYAVPGAADRIDLVALHPYSSTLGGMSFQIREARRVMVAAGDGRKQMLISELGVASDSQLPTGFNWGLKGQASFLRRAFDLLLRARERWHIAGVEWYAWQDMPGSDPHCVFCQHAGLLDGAGKPKPAWWAFKRIAARGAAGV